MIITYAFFLLGLVFLVRGSNWIVASSSTIAKRLGVSDLVIGLTIVAFGTSLPELVVNVFSSSAGAPEIIFGNVIGSNIANVLFTLALIACVTKIKLREETIWHELPFAILAGFILFILTGNLFGAKEYLTRDDALILLGLFAVFLYYIYSMARKSKKFHVVSIIDKSNFKVISKLILGLVAVYFGGRWTVEGAILMATQIGLSEFLISATIIAIGTSLPELVVSLVAARKGNIDLAVGNIIGSNVFNICWVLGLVPLLNPIAIPSFIGFDIGIMILATIVIFIMMFIGERHELKRRDGILLLLFYVLYIWQLALRG
jgi:cation:H+ antiporter